MNCEPILQDPTARDWHQLNVEQLIYAAKDGRKVLNIVIKGLEQLRAVNPDNLTEDSRANLASQLEDFRLLLATLASVTSQWSGR